MDNARVSGVQIIILHMPRQLGCRGMCKIGRPKQQLLVGMTELEVIPGWEKHLAIIASSA